MALTGIIGFIGLLVPHLARLLVGVGHRRSLPLSALLGAALLTFVDCLKELPASLLLRPLNVETLSTYIYQFATRGNFEEGALAALLIVAAGIPAVIWTTRYADALVRPSGSAEKRRQR